MWCKFKGNTENVPYNVPYAQSVGGIGCIMHCLLLFDNYLLSLSRLHAHDVYAAL